jgi:hypothetical protein
MAFRVYNRKYESYHHVGDPKGVMAHRHRATEWSDRADAEQVAAQLNERDRQPDYGELGHDDWVVVTD